MKQSLREFLVLSEFGYLPETMKEIMSLYDDRDVHLSALMLEFFQNAGIAPDEAIDCIELDEHNIKFDLADEPQFVVIGSDDPIYVCLINKEPAAAFYASFRGKYQAGGYIKKENKSFFATDLSIDGVKPNTWIERESVCGEIARDAVNETILNYVNK